MKKDTIKTIINVPTDLIIDEQTLGNCFNVNRFNWSGKIIFPKKLGNSNDLKFEKEVYDGWRPGYDLECGKKHNDGSFRVKLLLFKSVVDSEVDQQLLLAQLEEFISLFF